MKGKFVLKAVTYVGILASGFMAVVAGGAMVSYGFGFVFALMFCMGIAGVCLGGLYLNELDERWLTSQVRLEDYESMTPYPVLDRI
jgi:hypothetical protein